jgi:hypothetical protein
LKVGYWFWLGGFSKDLRNGHLHTLKRSHPGCPGRKRVMVMALKRSIARVSS